MLIAPCTDTRCTCSLPSCSCVPAHTAAAFSGQSGLRNRAWKFLIAAACICPPKTQLMLMLLQAHLNHLQRLRPQASSSSSGTAGGICPPSLKQRSHRAQAVGLWAMSLLQRCSRSPAQVRHAQRQQARGHLLWLQSPASLGRVHTRYSLHEPWTNLRAASATELSTNDKIVHAPASCPSYCKCLNRLRQDGVHLAVIALITCQIIDVALMCSTASAPECLLAGGGSPSTACQTWQGVGRRQR